MTKFTIVTDANGNFVAAIRGHELTTKHDGLTAQVSFPKEHRLHKVEVGDELAAATDPGLFQEGILKHLPRR